MAPEHPVASQEEWDSAWKEQIAREKELTRRADELTRARAELPWVEVAADHRFETESGTKNLADLFDGRSQLLIYHFMFGPAYEAGCTVCSSIADNLNPNVPHLAARDVTLMLVSRGPLEKLLAYRERMGWTIPWASTVGSDFNSALGLVHTPEEVKQFFPDEVPPTVEHMARASGTDATGYVAEGPGLSAYALEDGTVYRTYFTSARGLEVPGMAFYSLLDRTPRGRQEEGDAPLWLRRHDEYQS